jgi:hypothetical protein
MNIRESNDLNAVLHFLLGDTASNGSTITSERAREAAARLADRAAKTLLAGLTGDQVTERWPATSPVEDRATLQLGRDEASSAALPEGRDEAIVAHFRLYLQWCHQRERADSAEATVQRGRDAIHIADADDITDWQRGYRALANRVSAALDGGGS